MSVPNEIYIRKIREIGKVAVWLVDGAKVRVDLDENFSEFGDKPEFFVIPTNEYWIDNDTKEEEWKFFIDHMIIRNRELKSGKTFDIANRIADGIETRERDKEIHMRKCDVKKHDPKIIERVHQEPWKEFSDKVTIWIVDGKIVRDLLYVEYTEGGHDRVYSFIPDNEIWIEKNLTWEERKFILAHELHERYLMGEGDDYHHAHWGATIIEDRFRENPEGLIERIKEEVKKNSEQIHNKKHTVV